jgi:hypothetical protein
MPLKYEGLRGFHLKFQHTGLWKTAAADGEMELDEDSYLIINVCSAVQ